MKKVILILLFLMSGCSSSPERSGDAMYSPSSASGGKSRAHPAAYSSDSFVIKKSQPSRSPNSTVDFFFKHCTNSFNDTYYSKTSYSCSRP